MGSESAWFILVERENEHSLLVGPYEDQETAVAHMNDGVYIQSLSEDDALEIMVVELPILDTNPNPYVSHIILITTPPEEDLPDAEVIDIGVFHHGVQEVME